MSSNFVVFLIGYIFLIAGVVFALHIIGIGTEWIIAASLVMVGIGLIAAFTRSKKGDVADAKAESQSNSSDYASSS